MDYAGQEARVRIGTFRAAHTLVGFSQTDKKLYPTHSWPYGHVCEYSRNIIREVSGMNVLVLFK